MWPLEVSIFVTISIDNTLDCGLVEMYHPSWYTVSEIESLHRSLSVLDAWRTWTSIVCNSAAQCQALLYHAISIMWFFCFYVFQSWFPATMTTWYARTRWARMTYKVLWRHLVRAVPSFVACCRFDGGAKDGVGGTRADWVSRSHDAIRCHGAVASGCSRDTNTRLLKYCLYNNSRFVHHC